MRKYDRIPQPFLLLVDGPADQAISDGLLRWGLRLFGSSASLWPYAVESFQRLGEQGIGQAGVRFELTEVSDGSDGSPLWRAHDSHLGEPHRRSIESVHHVPERIRFEFHTPVHLRRGGALLEQPGPLDLILAVRRRLKILDAFYGDGEKTPTVAEPPHISAEAFCGATSSMQTWSIARFSTRQRRRIGLSGVTGSLEASGPWHEVSDVLAAAPVVHVGKGTSFGLGRIRWEDAA